jgi:hypothetical protein
MRAFFPLGPVPALPSFPGMHRFAAELFAENRSVLLVGEHEHLVVLVLPRNGMPVPRERKLPVPTKLSKLIKVLASTIIFAKSDPVGKVIVRCPKYPTMNAHRNRRSIGPLIALFVPGYLRRPSPTCRSRSAHSSSIFASMRASNSSAEPVLLPAR